MASPKIKLKLLIDTKAKKLLYAEAGTDFVDFLIYVLTLPVATVVKVLKEKSLVGSLGHLYESLENLPESYLQPNQNKKSLLNPSPPIYATEIPLMLADYDLTNRKSYTCYSHSGNMADVPGLICVQSGCSQKMYREWAYVPPSPANTVVSVEGGFLKGLVNYIVMDNLEVIPMSSKHVVTLLNKFNVKDVGAVEEIVVDFGVEEGLKLLKLSLECKTVLTNFYLGNVGST
ncbi:hypothetical protein LWI28_002020 [Acer negundo]|uniref:DUF674 domain-containing protein n=1 Tax=Acer negundo TaxID=4023 RepID=A0AAD5I8U8_ACENE|nr:hypothetical protein LWI28_002020 [Acer negundo]